MSESHDEAQRMNAFLGRGLTDTGPDLRLTLGMGPHAAAFVTYVNLLDEPDEQGEQGEQNAPRPLPEICPRRERRLARRRGLLLLEAYALGFFALCLCVALAVLGGWI